MLIAPIILAIAATASQPTTGDIVVIGQAIKDSQKRLEECLARHCPVDEDIAATLALAESQLLAGNYRDARKILLASLGRNKGEAARYPIPVSDLYRANGKVAASLGFDQDYYSSTWGIYRTLKYGLPNEKDRQYSALMEVAEMMYKTRGHEAARRYYDRLAAEAQRDGRADIAALAKLRSAIRHAPPWSRETEIKSILKSTDPELRAPILEGTLALARLAYARHDDQAGDAALARLSALNIQRPILVYSPDYELDVQSDQSLNESSSVSPVPIPSVVTPVGMRRQQRDTEDRWLDVVFRINDRGRVEDLEVAKSKGDIAWATPLLLSIKDRRYTPTFLGKEVSTRRERYTYTSSVENGVGSHLQAHSPNTRVEYLDLSDLGG